VLFLRPVNEVLDAGKLTLNLIANSSSQVDVIIDTSGPFVAVVEFEK
jgi:hypothetical protein